jgi:hypothetical protein
MSVGVGGVSGRYPQEQISLRQIQGYTLQAQWSSMHVQLGITGLSSKDQALTRLGRLGRGELEGSDSEGASSARGLDCRGR